MYTVQNAKKCTKNAPKKHRIPKSILLLFIIIYLLFVNFFIHRTKNERITKTKKLLFFFTFDESCNNATHIYTNYLFCIFSSFVIGAYFFHQTYFNENQFKKKEKPRKTERTEEKEKDANECCLHKFFIFSIFFIGSNKFCNFEWFEKAKRWAGRFSAPFLV